MLLAAALWWRGHGFYGLSVAARVEHDDYRTLSASGLVGHGYGIVGTGLMLTNLLYLVRRRFPNLPVGSMRLWLDIHVFTGLSGALLVLFHSAFQLRTQLAAASAYSVALVVVTGLVGRNLVAFAPRVDQAALDAGLETLEATYPGIARELRSTLDKITITEPAVAMTLVGAVRLVPTWRSEASARARAVRDRVEARRRPAETDSGRGARTDVALAVVEREARRGAYAVAGRVFLDSWRGFHRFFAFALVVTVTIHVGVAWYYGFRWIYSVE